MSPPPFDGFGSRFLAACGRGMVWELYVFVAVVYARAGGAKTATILLKNPACTPVGIIIDTSMKMDTALRHITSGICVI